MNNINKNWKEFLINEAGLNKIRQDMLDHDTAFITAFRGDIDDKSMCLYIPPSEEELSERDKMGKNYRRGESNKRNNKELSAFLLSQGYGIKNMQGSYIENFKSIDPKKIPREVKEASFFVVNLNDDPEFSQEIIDLGKRYCQDSVIIAPKGEEGYIYGTNRGKYPGLDQQETVGKFAGGETGEFMSRIKSRPFVMKEDEEIETYEGLPGKQRQAAKLIAKRVDKEINEMNMLGEADLQDYSKGGNITLYHYAPVDADEIEVDPSRFGKQSYSRREKEKSSFPRSFFYVNLDQAENQVTPGKTLFSLEFPTNMLYSIKDDPDGLVDTIRHPTYGFRNDVEWTELFETISKDYSGAYYSTTSMDIVVLFEPVKANKVE